MVNICEPLINVVTLNKPKRLRVSTRDHRLGPKGKGSGIGVHHSPIADVAPSANRRNLTHLNQVLGRNVVSRSVSRRIHPFGKASRKERRWAGR